MTDPIRNGGKHPFKYHAPTKDQAQVMSLVNDKFFLAYEAIIDSVPANRERSLAITKLQEARMWVNAAIVLSE